MSTLAPLTDIAADACDARLPHEFDPAYVLLTLERIPLQTTALDKLIAWLDEIIAARNL